MSDRTSPVEGSEELDTSMTLNDAVKAVASERAERRADESEEQDIAADPNTDETADPEARDGEQPEEKADEASEEEEPAVAGDDVYVELEDGTKLSIRDLKDSYFRADDYSRKTQEAAKERRDLQTLTQQVQGSIDRIAGYLAQRLPPEPDPKLAYENPGLHYQQKLVYDAAMQEIFGILNVKEQIQEAGKTVSEADFAASMNAENELLIRKMPHFKEPKRLEAFNRKVEAYAKSLGFPDEMIKATVDHRIRIMAYDAAEGREARAARMQSKAKVQSAAPMLPAKQRQSANSMKALQQVNAVKRLEKSGSMKDALAALAASR